MWDQIKRNQGGRRMKLNTVFEKLKETEEGRAVITYTQKLQEDLKQAREDEEATAIKAQEQIDKLNEELEEAEGLCEMFFAGLFMAIRKRVVEPKGIELGKTQEEITQMTLDTMGVYLAEKVDYDEVEKLLEDVNEKVDENILTNLFKKFSDSDSGDHIPRID